MHQIPLFMTGLRKDFDWLDDMLRHKKVNRLAQLLQKKMEHFLSQTTIPAGS